jgi:hypothetical protein
MSAVPGERVEQMRIAITEVLNKKGSAVFLNRVNTILDDWASAKINAAEACEKIQKIVTLFIGHEEASQIGVRCAPIVMRESASNRKS